MAGPDRIPVVVTRLDRSRFRLRNADSMAMVFFKEDPSSRYGLDKKGYDAWIAERAQDRDWLQTVTKDDIDIINGSNMHMRSPLHVWTQFLSHGPLHWLQDIPSTTRLEHLEESDWVRHGQAIQVAIETLIEPNGISIAGATKILHMKRPLLIPILDSYVGSVLQTSKPRKKTELASWSWRTIVQLRSILLENRDSMSTIQEILQREGIARSQVRILDALLWTLDPRTKFAQHAEIDETF